MSERSEFSGPPADNVRSEGTPKGRRGGRASLLTFLSRDKKVSRPPGRNPGRSRQKYRTIGHDPFSLNPAIPHKAKLTVSEFQAVMPAQRTRYSAPPETPRSVCLSLVSRRAQSVDGGAVRPCMSERSEFAGPPADNVRSEGTPKGRRGGCVSLLTFLSHNKKVSRPPGRTPGRSRPERSPNKQIPPGRKK